MLHKLLRALGILAYLAVVALLFVVVGYVSFSLFVRSGATRTPELAGLSIAEARDVLADQGLELELEKDGRYDPQIPVDHVIRQTPGEGAIVKRGSAVRVVPSLGPQRVPMPELGGKSVQAAQVQIAAAGLTLGRTVEVYGEDTPEGTVVGQQPAAGGTVPPGATVDLLVARQGSRDQFIMPDLVYRRYGDVRRFFESRGFRIGSVKFERYEGIRPGVILRQFPVAGHPLGRGDTISLVVAADERGRPGSAAQAAAEPGAEAAAGPAGPTAEPAAAETAPAPTTARRKR